MAGLVFPTILNLQAVRRLGRARTHYVPLKRREIPTQRQRITSQKTRSYNTYYSFGGCNRDPIHPGYMGFN